MDEFERLHCGKQHPILVRIAGWGVETALNVPHRTRAFLSRGRGPVARALRRYYEERDWASYHGPATVPDEASSRILTMMGGRQPLAWKVTLYRMKVLRVLRAWGIPQALATIPRSFSRVMSLVRTVVSRSKRPILIGLGGVALAGCIAMGVVVYRYRKSQEVTPLELLRLEVEARDDLIEADFHEMDEDEVYRTIVRPNSLRYNPRMLRALARGGHYRHDRRSTRGRGVPYRGELILNSAIHEWAMDYMLCPGAPYDDEGFRSDLYHRILARARSEGFWFEASSGVHQVEADDEILEPLLRLCAFDAVQLGSSNYNDCSVIKSNISKTSYRQAWELFYMREGRLTGPTFRQKMDILRGELWLAFGCAVTLPPKA